VDVSQRRAYSCAKTIFRWCVRNEKLTVDPTAHIDLDDDLWLGMSDTARSRTLLDNELKAVWNHAVGYPFGPLVQLLLLTGARLREISEAS
jgi:hypothetical protein